MNGDAPVPTGFTTVPNTGDLTITENMDALPVGYMVSPDVLSFATMNRNNPFATSNKFVESLGAAAVYSPDVLLDKDLINASLSSGNAENGYAYTINADKAKTVINIKPNARVTGSQLYLYVQSTEAPSVTVSGTNPDTTEPSSKQQETRTGQIIDLGTYDPSIDQNVQLSWDSATSGQVTILCYSINDEAYRNMLSTLGQSGLTVTSYDSTHLNGTVDAVSDGVLLLTVPFDKGWTAIVDGKSAAISNIGDALMGLNLTSGTHEISMSYSPEGIGPGSKISVESFIVLILLSLITFSVEMNRRIRKGREILAEEANLPDGTTTAEDVNLPDGTSTAEAANHPDETTTTGESLPEEKSL